jgi:hypothetical protein
MRPTKITAASLGRALASFTVGSNGNTIDNGAKLKTPVCPVLMAINPQGNLLAVSAATSDPSSTKYGPGLQVFHFNGAKPITGYSSVLTKDAISSIA